MAESGTHVNALLNESVGSVEKDKQKGTWMEVPLVWERNDEYMTRGSTKAVRRQYEGSTKFGRFLGDAGAGLVPGVQPESARYVHRQPNTRAGHRQLRHSCPVQPNQPPESSSGTTAYRDKPPATHGKHSSLPPLLGPVVSPRLAESEAWCLRCQAACADVLPSKLHIAASQAGNAACGPTAWPPGTSAREYVGASARPPACSTARALHADVRVHAGASVCAAVPMFRMVAAAPATRRRWGGVSVCS
jgi:hypothetical protein